ncbi:SDR family NAD(P)-dependent oxidoreductase [Sorangium sp. So ce1389]|uniref:SDR family NAD(P)-dependent oxidoreductase n=1 Tax=Sorangium sp. So ce1389 TaxID=3133336 RepID=UPI003F5E78C8
MNELSARSGIDPRAIDVREPFSRYGLDSRGAAELLAALGAALGRSLPATLVWEHPTPAALSRYLAGDLAEASPRPRERVSSGGAEDEPVAIVGLACRFPRAPNADAYWRLLADRVDAITEIPPDRWNGDALFARELDAVGKMNTRWGGFLDRIDEFEPLFFGISPKEALHMDPQQRLMLELAWEALEDAGFPAERLQGSRTGVFCGVVWTDYATLLQRGGIENIGQHTVTGFHHSIVANRISYTLGLEGPSLSLDTACSSSLVAVHLACESLRKGESALALAGGVNLNLVPESTMGVSKFGALSPDGRCFTFDARANGYVRGEGAGLVVLKPLSRALADGDRIYCVIRGSAVNNDGASNGLTAPSPRAQEAVLRAAYERAAVDPADVQYVEAHGTGTQLGDPIEARALGAVLGAGAGRSPDRPLRVGSSKTNIGHLEAAAGVAALIKAALCIQRRALPPSLHFEAPNPHIPFDALRLEVQRDLGPWPEPERPLTAGVSAFGFGGTNCHVVLQEWRASRAELLALAAPSPEALRAAAEQLAARLASPGEDEPLPALCRSAAERHRDGAHRLAATSRSRSELRQQLEGFLAGEKRAGLSTGHAERARGARPVFVFSGQGSQWLGMGRVLARTEPVFRAALERCDELVQRFLGWSLLDELDAGEARSRLDRIDVTCPVIVSVEIALAALWRSWGVEPSAVVGHSIGEVAAAHVAGVLDLEDAMRVICAQGAIIHRLRGRGAMGLVALSWEQAGEALAGHERELCRAIHVSPDSTVLSGEPAALDALLEALQRRGIFCRRVAVDVAAHSAQLDPLRGELLELLREVRPRQERLPIVSTVTASPLAGRSFDAPHWVKNLADPVLFSGAVEHLAREGHALFVEVSPHPLVTRAVESILRSAGRPGAIFPSLRRHEDDRAAMLDSLGALFAHGQTVGVRELFAGAAPAPSPGREEGGAGAAAPEEPAQLLPLSARSPEALAALAEAYRGFLTGAAEPAATIEDIAYTAGARRSHLAHRLAVVGRSREEWAEALAACAAGEPHAGLFQAEARLEVRPRVVFVFPGQGSQWAGMGRELLRDEPVFRREIEACERAMRPHVDWSLAEELGAEEGRSRLDRVDVVQPLLFAMQVALAALWRAWGVEPHAVVGHSMGEIAAAHVAGALSLEDAARIICRRSRLVRRASGQGGMAVVELDLERAEEALAGHEARLSVAASNGPRSTVLSGDTAALDEVLLGLERRGVFCRRVKVDYASHSPQMDPLTDELLRELEGIAPRPAALPICSTVTGRAGDGSDFDPAYWARNLRAPVLFRGAIEQLLEGGHGVFIEVSAHPVLLASIEETRRAAGRPALALASLRRQAEERASLLGSLAALHAHGGAVDWRRFHEGRGRVIALPSYPWQRERHWLDEPAEPAGRARPARTGRGPRAPRGGEADGHPLLGGSLASSVQPGARFWERSVSVEELPYLDDHRLQGEVVFPGAGYVEMALAAGAEVFSAGLALEGLTIEAMLALPEGRARTVQLALIEEGAGRASFQIASRAEGEASFRRHAAGTLRLADGLARAAGDAAEPPAQLAERLGAALDPEAAYRRRQAQGVDFGPAFRGVRQLWRGEGEALARVSLPEGAARGAYRIHPALLDACFQVAAELVEDGEGLCVPVAIARAQVSSSIGREVWVRARAATSAGDGERAFDLALVDDEGRLVASIEGLKVRRLDAGRAAADGLGDCVYAVAWRRAEPPPEPPRAEGEARGAWLLLADRSGTGEALEALLRARGDRCVRVEAGGAYARGAADRYTVDPAAREDYRRLLGDAFGEEGTCRGVVHLFSLDSAAFEATTPGTLDADLRRGSVSAAYLAQAIVRHGFRDAPRLWLVTRGARAVAGETRRDAVEAAQAPLWGLGQTIATEHPELACSRLDLDPAPSARDAALLAREIGAAAQDDQIALRGGERYVAQLVRSRFEDGEPPGDGRRAEPARGRPFRLEIDEPGVLERLALREIRRRPPGPGEVEIAVDAAGLNFLDVMKALGTYPGMAPGPVALGNECAGRVVGVGEGVRGLEIGQEVIAVAPGAFATHVTAPARAVAPKPARLTPAQAAAIPSVFMTAWYALNHLGRARRGERVLIHAASGGTGLAALQIARALGLEVFATAGSEEKRAFLRSLGVARAMDSRTLAFADEILGATGGRGVDLVLNSLTGEAAQKSLEVLAPYGRFLELGKRDIHDGVRLGLAPFKKSLSYSSIDLAGMAEERPDLFASLLAEVVRRFEEGAFEPLPVEIVPASLAEEAFRRMAQAKHIGKLVIAMDDPEARVAPAADSAPAIRADASYLITGGLGALGLAAAGWLVEQGARHLVLVGRRAPSDEARAAIGALEAAGARVRAAQADVASDDEVRRLVAELGATMPPLRGVVHAAGLLDDHTLLELSEEHFRRVFAPKVHGAFNLHARTLDAPLDFFVMYSSIATTLGAPDQGNYAAANAFLDALAQRRRSMRLPAMSVAWGAFAEVGLAAADDLRGARVAQRGVGGFSPAEGLAALARLLDRPRAEVVVARFEARKWVEFYPRAGESPFLAELLKEAPDASPGAAAAAALRESLAAEPPAERLARLEEHIREQVGRVLRLPAARVGRLAPFRSLGVDSLMSLELRNRIEASVGLRLSTTLLFAYPHAAALSEHLLERLGLAAGAEEATSAEEAGAPASEAEALERRERALDELSDEALASLLAEKLLTA